MKNISIILVLLLLFCLGCSNNKPAVSDKSSISVSTKDALAAEKAKLKKDKKIASEDVSKIPEVKLETSDVKLEWAGKDGKVMTSYAKGFEGNQKDSILVLHDFTATLYEKGKKSCTLEAPKAILDVNKQEIKVINGVRLTSLISKSTLVANKILWKSKKNKVYAEDAVLTTTYGSITGKFFILDTKLETFEVSDKSKNIF